MKKAALFLGLILILFIICGVESCSDNALILDNESIGLNENNSVLSFIPSASVIEIQQQAEQTLQDKICNLLPMQASRLPSDMLSVGVKAPELGDWINITFPQYYLMKSGNEIYYDCFAYGLLTGDGAKECLIPFTADLMDSDSNIITSETGAIRLVFEGPLEALKDNPDYIQPTQDGPAPKNLQQLTKILTSTFSRTECGLQIDSPCEVQEDYSFCGQCSYSTISTDESYYRGTCWTCPPGTFCSGGDDYTHCAQVSCVSSNQNKNIGAQYYFASCGNCQTGPYRDYYYNGLDFNRCNYYYGLCLQSQCADKRTNCG